MTLDYTFEKRLEMQREEAAEEGRIEGEKLGRIEGEKLGRIEGEKLGRIEGEKLGRIEGEKLGMQEKLRELVYKKLLKKKSLEQIAEELEESTESLLPIYEQIKTEME